MYSTPGVKPDTTMLPVSEVTSRGASPPWLGRTPSWMEVSKTNMKDLMLPSPKRLQVHSHSKSSFTCAHRALPRVGKEVGAHCGYSAINWRVSSLGTRAVYNRNVITAV